MSYDIKIGNPSGPFAFGGHDILLDKQGGTISLFGKDKLEQDILKILFTEVNNFYSEYSTLLNEIIGTNLGIEETVNVLYERILNSIVYLQLLQEQQQKHQQVQSDEIIERIRSISVDYLYDLTHDNNDVTKFRVRIILENADSELITISKDVTAV